MERDIDRKQKTIMAIKNKYLWIPTIDYYIYRSNVSH